MTSIPELEDWSLLEAFILAQSQPSAPQTLSPLSTDGPTPSCATWPNLSTPDQQPDLINSTSYPSTEPFPFPFSAHHYSRASPAGQGLSSDLRTELDFEVEMYIERYGTREQQQRQYGGKGVYGREQSREMVPSPASLPFNSQPTQLASSSYFIPPPPRTYGTSTSTFNSYPGMSYPAGYNALASPFDSASNDRLPLSISQYRSSSRPPISRSRQSSSSTQSSSAFSNSSFANSSCSYYDSSSSTTSHLDQLSTSPSSPLPSTKPSPLPL
jgi:hypothetical protein